MPESKLPKDIWDHPDPFIVSVTVKPDYIDDFQHTNNVVYLTWMAKAAWEHSQALGLDFDAYAKIGKGMVVRAHEMEYLGPSHEGETVDIATWITGNDGKLRLRRRFQMVNAETGKTLLRGRSDFVCIDIQSGKPKRMPQSFVDAYALTANVPQDQTT
ncbi:MAG: acyl-CoA thioesterase [Rhodobiaceae bacterium]|nr:acyl-CoA thioesterase [Rhodobiaceae bacterium]